MCLRVSAKTQKRGESIDVESRDSTFLFSYELRWVDLTLICRYLHSTRAPVCSTSRRGDLLFTVVENDHSRSRALAASDSSVREREPVDIHFAVDSTHEVLARRMISGYEEEIEQLIRCKHDMLLEHFR